MKSLEFNQRRNPEFNWEKSTRTSSFCGFKSFKQWSEEGESGSFLFVQIHNSDNQWKWRTTWSSVRPYFFGHQKRCEQWNRPYSCLGYLLGMKILPNSDMWGLFQKLLPRIPINQPGWLMESIRDLGFWSPRCRSLLPGCVSLKLAASLPLKKNPLGKFGDSYWKPSFLVAKLLVPGRVKHFKWWFIGNLISTWFHTT